MSKKLVGADEVTLVKKSKVKRFFKFILMFMIVRAVLNKVGKLISKFIDEDAKTKDELTKCYAFFSGKSMKIDNEIFKGAKIKALCSGVALDLSNSIIQEDIEIHCKNIMSGTSIVVPNNVKIEIKEQSKWSGTSNQVPVVDELEAPTIHIFVNNLMSGLEVKLSDVTE